ncbi:MAG: helix-turn-helix domain-containing protein [Ruminococcus sp.]|nr:helix-turn-helix domain-containing protein [Ruminococcus sp.]
MDMKIKRGQILKELRKSKGLSQAFFSKMFDISSAAYQKYEYGTAEPPFDTLCKLADFYGVSTDYLLGRTPVKRMATEETDLFANIDVAELEKRIIEKYTALNEEMRAFCIDLFRQQTGVIITENGEVQHETPRSDIQLSQNFIKAIARSKSNPFREAPTPEQIASLTPVPEDSDL